MTDKEFKRLSRSQLIDIIYQLQLKQNELEEENRKLKAEVGDKRIRLREAGNIAEASLAMHNVMQSAQDAANQYLEEIRAMKQDTAEACNRILEKAKQEAAAIVARANQKHTVYDSAVDAILKEYQQEK
jgi:cell division septum initiation protein DivIVA